MSKKRPKPEVLQSKIVCGKHVIYQCRCRKCGGLFWTNDPRISGGLCVDHSLDPGEHYPNPASSVNGQQGQVVRSEYRYNGSLTNF